MFDTDSGATVASHSLCRGIRTISTMTPHATGSMRLRRGLGGCLRDRRGDKLVRLARVQTDLSARTDLFSPTLDRLFVAVRAVGGKRDAAIEVFRPVS